MQSRRFAVDGFLARIQYITQNLGSRLNLAATSSLVDEVRRFVAKRLSGTAGVGDVD